MGLPPNAPSASGVQKRADKRLGGKRADVGRRLHAGPQQITCGREANGFDHRFLPGKGITGGVIVLWISRLCRNRGHIYGHGGRGTAAARLYAVKHPF
jgi:hypothetical protein